MVKFGNIFVNIIIIEAELKDMESTIMDQGMTLEAFNKEKALKSRLNEILAREEVYWKQKSREGWIKEGDRNTKFFHNSVKVRRSWNKVTAIKNRANIILDKLEDINKEAMDFFSELLSKRQILDSQHQDTLLNNIPKVILDNHSQVLCKLILIDEVKQAIFSMVGDKAPRTGQFPIFFYQQFWDVVGHEVWHVVEEARINLNVEKELNCTFLSLIPKVEKPTSFGDFRPISLYNVL
ncbi:uncharacterized protein LOC131036058 [Cryptomeria japonica]|uniref:uncharacterized protein LOC131036058 n=1 Tax=Cryptomeria japonica TaxID=3369 RepID=UPI0027DAAD8B|nr:uncharacterized protein LOC131036058 [Cryptomeria japonica]